jgi:hypothetical protein
MGALTGVIAGVTVVVVDSTGTSVASATIGRKQQGAGPNASISQLRFLPGWLVCRIKRETDLSLMST